MKSEMDRRQFSKLAMGALAAAGLAGRGHAQTAFPNKTTQLVVAYAAGGITDVLSRSLALGMAAGESKFPIIVDNKPGGSTSLASGFVARAPTDGHTVLMTTSDTATLLPHTLSIAFDPLKTLAPVAHVASTPLYIYGNLDLPVKDLKGLIAWMKANPGKISCGSYGQGTLGHFGALILGRAAGVEMVHVPFQGGAPGMQALLGGHVQLMVDAYPSMEHVKAGKALALAVSSPERSPYAPNVPTVRELGLPELEMISGYLAMFAPKGTPPETLRALNLMVRKAVDTPEFKKNMPRMGLLPSPPYTPAEFEAVVRRENASWGKFIKEINYRPNES